MEVVGLAYLQVRQQNLMEKSKQSDRSNLDPEGTLLPFPQNLIPLFVADANQMLQ
jgi:hypothetical protein